MNKTIKDIEKLNPNFRKKAKAFLKEMESIDPMKAHETLRTAERQKYLLSTGASRVKRSNHQDGNAMDIHFVNAPHFPPAGHKRWRKAAEIAKKHGIDCGGIIWNWDWNHFQDDGSPAQEIVIKRTELQQKTLNNIIESNSLLWHIADEETQKVLEKTNKLLRKL